MRQFSSLEAAPLELSSNLPQLSLLVPTARGTSDFHNYKTVKSASNSVDPSLLTLSLAV